MADVDEKAREYLIRNVLEPAFPGIQPLPVALPTPPAQEPTDER